MSQTRLRFLFRKNHILLWLPPVIYFGIISFLSSLSHPPQVFPDFAYIDKFEHFSVYFVFGFLLARSGIWELVWHPVWSFKIKLILVCIIISAGAIDEWHQSFVPNRMVDFFDWVADTCGATCGYLLGRWIYNIRIKKILKERQL